jgi:hypothetical protein
LSKTPSPDAISAGYPANGRKPLRTSHASSEKMTKLASWPNILRDLSYSVILKSTDPSIPEEFRLPEAFRLNVATASDADVVQAVVKLVTAYTESLVFSQDESGVFNLSPYDVFLETNGLSRKPAPREPLWTMGIRLTAEDVRPLAAFLRALNEDYE